MAILVHKSNVGAIKRDNCDGAKMLHNFAFSGAASRHAERVAANRNNRGVEKHLGIKNVKVMLSR